ncbi:single-stranded DNA-binding protein [Phycicoccus sp. Soil748]|uniref:single-stranded DNA-binding protein n=1 Tax=Phycicoccus sp. Soil748 TaxID=1736397 RepID=UPI000AB9E188|nr:single-stranded DNA-binding protein [Phycicoccus sp. Soil748]
MDDMGEWVNEVRLVGRVSGAGEERELPSGDTVVQLRVVVPRPARAGAAAGTGGGARVDTIDVACWTARTRRSALRLADGATVEVTGALRRRFFRAGPATVSRYEVEASRVAAVRSVRAAAG